MKLKMLFQIVSDVAREFLFQVVKEGNCWCTIHSFPDWLFPFVIYPLKIRF